MSQQVKNKPADIFTRKNVMLTRPGQIQAGQAKSTPIPLLQDESEIKENHSSDQKNEFIALVVNSSQDMAKEITMQITLNMPDCSIMYAPSISIAKWILQRRKIGLVISNPILPDGSVTKLQNALEKMESPPDLIVVGQNNVIDMAVIKNSNYKFKTVRTLAAKPETKIIESNNDNSLNKAVRNLGADLRNDLNNPLQEIVAMVFVAKAGGESSPHTDRALEAIDKAAKNLANVVSKIEGKILDVVDPQ